MSHQADHLIYLVPYRDVLPRYDTAKPTPDERDQCGSNGFKIHHFLDDVALDLLV